jgi:hypothetical protein
MVSAHTFMDFLKNIIGLGLKEAFEQGFGSIPFYIVLLRGGKTVLLESSPSELQPCLEVTTRFSGTE